MTIEQLLQDIFKADKLWELRYNETLGFVMRRTIHRGSAEPVRTKVYGMDLRDVLTRVWSKYYREEKERYVSHDYLNA